MPNARQAALGVATVVAFLVLYGAFPQVRPAVDAVRALPQTIDRIDTQPLGEAIGAFAVDNPLVTLAVLGALGVAAAARRFAVAFDEQGRPRVRRIG